VAVRNLSPRPGVGGVVALLRKPEAAKVDVPVRVRRLRHPVGVRRRLRLDYAERYRDLPFVGLLRPEVYAVALSAGAGTPPRPALGLRVPAGVPFGSAIFRRDGAAAPHR
jgi:hypothetical protein